MADEQNNTQKLDLESVRRVKEKLSALKSEIDLRYLGRLEARLDSLASELLGSGLAESMAGAPSLSEILEKMKATRPVPDEAIEAARGLAYLMEEHWYGVTAPPEDRQEARRLAAVLCDTLTPILGE